MTAGEHSDAARRESTEADETVVRVKGEKAVVSVVADASTDEVLSMEAPVKRDSDGFMDWLLDFARDFGEEAMAADDLSTYKPVVRRLGMDHQICAAHVKKWARNRLCKIDGWERRYAPA